MLEGVSRRRVQPVHRYEGSAEQQRHRQRGGGHVPQRTGPPRPLAAALGRVAIISESAHVRHHNLAARLTRRSVAPNSRRRALLIALVVTLLAPPARADPNGPLTGLVEAAAQRLQVAEQVAAVKWNMQGPIEDPGRVR